jgi:hypothetical protein
MLWIVYSWRERPWYPLNVRLGGPHSRAGLDTLEKREVSFLAGNETAVPVLSGP